MIVDPDFFDHWRTQMLADAIGDKLAPIYVMRIWAHCQSRKNTRFDDMPAAGLRAVCRCPVDAELLESALVASGFVERDGNAICVPKWAIHNSSLIAAWANGSKGGRPPKPSNPTETHGLPTGSPSVTHGKPSGEPIGEDKRGVDKKKKDPEPPHAEIIEIFREELPTARHPRGWNEARKSLLRARWNEDEARQTVDWWREFFRYIQKSDFLCGRNGSANRKPFELSLDWLCNSTNFLKVLEGSYES